MSTTKPPTNGSSLPSSDTKVSEGKRKPGPKTPAAKAAVRRNAVKHGLTAQDATIYGMEDEDEWEEHLAAMAECLAPEGRLEEELVERIAVLAWRLRRVVRYEAAVTTRDVAGTEEQLAIAEAYKARTLADGVLPEMNPEYVAAYQVTHVLPGASDMEKIIRYEAHLHRQWLQTLHELEAVQARRRGEPAHLARLDINSPPPA